MCPGRPLVRTALLLPLLLLPAVAMAQVSESPGTRAQGMGGAFVGVANDASAVFWNPGGLAGGAFFSLSIDGGPADAVPGGSQEAGRRSAWLLALSTPALGLAYYRLERTSVAAALTPAGPGYRQESLVTHHAGATLVQSLTDGIAVGTTLKAVRGLAASGLVETRDRDFVLREVELSGRSGTRFDLDAGIMARGALGGLGLVVRNLTEPTFRTAADGELALEREVRAGASILLLPDWTLASDVDLTRKTGVYGEVRELALGTEAQVLRRLAVRAGVRLNTVGAGGRSPALSVGGSYAVLGSLLLDGQVTRGSESAFSGWGVAGRMVF